GGYRRVRAYRPRSRRPAAAGTSAASPRGYTPKLRGVGPPALSSRGAVRRFLGDLRLATLIAGLVGCRHPVPAPSPAAPVRWRLAYHETFDQPFAEPERWVEDRYGDDSPYHVDEVDDDGAFFRRAVGPAFEQGLRAFRS